MTDFGKELIEKDLQSQKILLQEKALTFPKMKTIKLHLNKPKRVTSKELLNLLPKDFFDGDMESSRIIYATKAMTWLK